MIIQPTSCDAVRLFSRSKYVMTDIRSSMTAKTFEDRMMLLENSDWWMNEYTDAKFTVMSSNKGCKIMQKILNSNNVAVNDAEDLQIDDDA